MKNLNCRAQALLAALTILALSFGGGCGARARSPEREYQVDELRKQSASADTDTLERWLLAELISPDGSAAKALEARRTLERRSAPGMLGQLALGLDDMFHGALDTAPEHYLKAVELAWRSADPRAPYIAWFAASQAAQFRTNNPDLWRRFQPFVTQAIREPRGLGYRAREELVGLWRVEALAAAEQGVEERTASAHGCVRELSLAGPFGRNSALDLDKSFAAELPGPWPERWRADPLSGEEPHVLKTLRTGCSVTSDEPVPPGLFYAQSFVDLAEASELLLAVRGALRVWVDDQLVLTRDPRVFGAWLKLGVKLRLDRGRHRILAQISEPRTSLRVLAADGLPRPVKASQDGALPYSLSLPRVMPGANIWDAHLDQGRLTGFEDPLLRFLSAYLAGFEGQADVASVLLEPFVKEPKRASGPALSSAALFTGSDPLFALNQRRDLVRELEEQAYLKDPRLWRSRVALALWEGERVGLPEGARKLGALVDELPKVPDILRELANTYKELDWSAEHAKAVRKLAARFPNDPRALTPAVLLNDAQGNVADADRLAVEVARLDPDSELKLSRALNRQDYAEALTELRSIGARHPERRDISERIYDVLVRAGNDAEAWKKLELALKYEPRSERARLDLADARLASGSRTALSEALVAAVENGSTTAQIEQAVDLVEGMTELDHYRLAARPIIDAYEKSGVALSGTATRVLDYAAIWVHANGSSRMLEHEIIHVQSAEAVTSMAEQPLRPGVFLHLRVIKKDGRTFEPELVEGKPTVTMPHLEVGDYLETERIESTRAESRHGLRYIGPRWFFREEKVPYVRSELLIISPKNRPLLVETQNEVPKAEVTEAGPLLVQRFRVDRSAAAPQEPFSAPITETLPNLQFGWGVSLENNLQKLADSVADLVAIDPRIHRIAERIVEPLPASAKAERARRLYRWVVANVQNGEENDGRRIILGRNGNLWRAYQMLCRALGLEIDYVVAQNRLTLPARGPFSRAALYTQPVFRVKSEVGDLWLTFGGRYAPFGYVPAELRGMEGYLLTTEPPSQVRIPESKSQDLVRYAGKIRIAQDGSAELDFAQHFTGRYAMGFRDVLAEIPEDQLRGVLESRLLGAELRGVRLETYRIEALEEPDKPLVLHFKANMPGFAQRNGNTLTVFPPFTPRLTQIAALPSRQTTLLMVDALERKIELTLELPGGAALEEAPGVGELQDGDRRVEMRDSFERGQLNLNRSVNLPPGRITPQEYGKFAQFARLAEESLLRTVRVRLQ